MKMVKLRNRASGAWGSGVSGEVVRVPDETARGLVEDGGCVYVDEGAVEAQVEVAPEVAAEPRMDEAERPSRTGLRRRRSRTGK